MREDCDAGMFLSWHLCYIDLTLRVSQRRFSIENSDLSAVETLSDGQQPPSSKRKTGADTSTPSVSKDSASAEVRVPVPPLGITLLEGGMMLDDKTEMVPQPARPTGSNFWTLWDWHYKRLQVAFGPKDSQAWIRYAD